MSPKTLLTFSGMLTAGALFIILPSQALPAKASHSNLGPRNSGLLKPALQARLDLTSSAPPAVSVAKAEGVGDSVQNTSEKAAVNSLLDEAMKKFSQGFPDDAEALFQKVLIVDAHNSDALFDLGAIAESKVDLEKAEHFYELALKESPNDSDIQSALSAIKEKKQQSKGVAFSEKVNERANIIYQADGESQTIERPVTDPPNPTYSPKVAVNGLIETSPRGEGSDAPRIIRAAFVPHLTDSTENWLKRAHPDLASTLSNNNDDGLFELVDPGQKQNGKVCGFPARRIPLEDLSDALQAGHCKVLVSKQPAWQEIESHGVIGRNSPPTDFTEEAEIVRDFVKAGGYLILDGYDLANVSRLFPGTIESLQGLSCDKIVDAHLEVPDPILAESLVTNALWHVPNSLPLMKVIDPKAVRVLCSSNKLAKQLPSSGGALAAVFPWGRGYVLCLTGTLNNNSGYIAEQNYTENLFFNNLLDPAPKIHVALRQAIAANFIEAGLTKRRIPELQI